MIGKRNDLAELGKKGCQNKSSETKFKSIYGQARQGVAGFVNPSYLSWVGSRIQDILLN